MMIPDFVVVSFVSLVSLVSPTGSRTLDKKLGEKTTETAETTETTVKDDTKLRCCLFRLSRLSRRRNAC